MEHIDRLEIYLDGKRVGTMAPYNRYLTVFEYAEEWLQNGFSISPFSLPLTPGVKISSAYPFNGLFGIFADSLPDEWGRLLVDRMLRKDGERPEEADDFSRLSIAGSSGKGALEYKPVYKRESGKYKSNLDKLAEESEKILLGQDSEDLDLLFYIGGSSGGTRPKVMIRQDNEEWIVKFPAIYDPDDIGLMEYDYNLCARACGIEIPEVRLFPSRRCSGYFGAKRFDRKETPEGKKKIHMASASALLEVSHRVLSLDYTSLMALTWQLTKRMDELEKMFRLMCFNIFAHNRNDHSNNFSFLYENGEWRIAPAYDLIYSDSAGGEHAITVAGEGWEPSMNDLLAVAKKAGIRNAAARKIAENIMEVVNERLAKYL